ncbi:MAG: NAD-dependent dehydratase [Sphingobacteriales bacterium 50-39]|nr:SDR family oxidoreductase [Sphingobacteriales bacterium]OJW54350.1 MAG: NAD-dependent dehydratase [Sphingobacteriales bacterium 50-39]
MEKTKVLVLGAGGAIAGHVITFLVKNENIHLTLFAREASQIPGVHGKNISKVVGDVLNREQLSQAVEGQNIVYANLSGTVEKMAKEIVLTMQANRVHRLIFVTSLGIYDEVPGPFGKWNNKMIGSELVRYRKAADVIEASGLDYTIIRPAWLTDNDEVNYETTQKNEPFKGTEVSRKSVGSFIAEIIQHPEKEVKASVGVNKPGTEGAKPSFY